MNKNDVIERMAKVTDESKATCKNCLEALLDIIGDTMKKNGQVALAGFGTFLSAKRAARTGVNPATGKKMQIPAKRVPKFKPGKGLKDKVA